MKIMKTILSLFIITYLGVSINAQNFPITWNELYGMEYDESANNLKKIGDSSWTNCDGFSSNKLLPNENGSVLIKVRDHYSKVAIGLSKNNESCGYKDIEYAFYFNENGDVWVMENGLPVLNLGDLQDGSKLYIKRFGSSIKFYEERNVVFTSNNNWSGELYVDISALNDFQVIENIRVSFLNIHENKFTQNSGLIYNDSNKSFTKNNSTENWISSFVISENFLEPGASGVLQFRISDNSTTKGIGFLDEGLNSYQPSDFLHAFYFRDGVAYIFENGRVVSSLDASNSNERYAIVQKNNEIWYYKNSSVVYRSSPIANGNVVWGLSLLDGNGLESFKNVNSDFSHVRSIPTSLVSSDCDRIEMYSDDILEIEEVASVDGYEVKFVNRNNNRSVHYATITTSEYLVSQVLGIGAYDQTYDIQVRSKREGFYSDWGNVCESVMAKFRTTYSLRFQRDQKHAYTHVVDVVKVLYDQNYKDLQEIDLKIIDLNSGNHSEVTSNVSINQNNLDVGTNALELDISALNSGYYLIELIETKGEKKYLKFKKI